MKPMHTVAAAAIALGGLGLATPAMAAGPRANLALSTGAATLIQVEDHNNSWQNNDYWNQGTDRGRYGSNHWDRRNGSNNHWDRRQGSNDHWDRRNGSNNHWDRRWGSNEHWDRRRVHDNHGDWNRGNNDWRWGYGDNRDWRWGHDWHHTHWRVEHHPRFRYWRGRRIHRNDYVVIHDYRVYRLPPPRRGYFYARRNNNVFLVARATNRIADAFELLGRVGH